MSDNCPTCGGPATAWDVTLRFTGVASKEVLNDLLWKLRVQVRDGGLPMPDFLDAVPVRNPEVKHG